MKNRRIIACVLTISFLCANLSYAASDVVQKPSDLITLDADDIPLKDVLRALSEQSKASFIASQDVELRKVYLSFDRVPLEDALQSIAAVNGLEYRRKASGLIIFYARGASANSGLAGLVPGGASAGSGSADDGLGIETRVYRLRYSRLSISPIDVGGAGTIQDLSLLQKASFDTAESSALTAPTSTAPPAPGSSTANENYVVERGIDRVIASLLTPVGKLTADIQSNSLVVTDLPSKLDEIEGVLARLDRPAPQVLIEVHLMEIKKDALVNHGVEWGGDDGALASFTGGSRTTGFPFTEKIFNDADGVKATSQGTSSLTLGTLSANDFQATLHFLTQDINTKILARPRVLTVSNEAANIKLVTNTAIANQTSLTTADGQSTSTSNTAERSQVGITLKMTPQVSDDETVELFLEPSITTVSASNFFPSTFLDPTTRLVRTVTRVKNHQTLVIGGLMDKNGSQSVKKIPFLGDLPLLGSAFKYNNNNDAERELVIFITPHIVQAYDSTDEGAQPFRQTDEAMRRVLSAFEDAQMATGLDLAESHEAKKNFVYRQEKKMIQHSSRKRESSSANREMTRSLEARGGG